MRKINSENEDDVVNVHPDMKNLLSHRVFPIPPRILGYLWDYGSLNKQSERNYIQSMIRKLKLPKNFENCMARSVESSQNFIKEIVEKRQSSVSLRDIKRVIKIFHFYACYVEFRSNRENYLKDNKMESKNKDDEKNKTEENIQETKQTNQKKKDKTSNNYFKKRYNDFDDFFESKSGYNHSEMPFETFNVVFTSTLILNYVFRIANEGNKNIDFLIFRR